MAQQPTRTLDEVDEEDSLMMALETPGANALIARVAQGAGTLMSERTLFGEAMMAQPTKAPRDEAKILRKIDAMAGAAGESWFYRYPVRKKDKDTGKFIVDYIEGPSIDCTDAVARMYGNCRLDCAVVDIGPGWLIYSRFVDHETGFTLIRPFLQSKAGSRLGGDDAERRLQISLAIGTSKSQRNVVDHALRDFTRRGFEGAKRNLVERIGRKLAEYRGRVVGKLNELGPDMLARVERIYSRTSADWLAPDVARMIAELRAIADGMATVDETWPTAPPPEPKRNDATDVEHQEVSGDAGTAVAGAPPASANAPADAAPSKPAAEPPPSQPAPPPPPRDWAMPADILGQDAIVRRLHAMLAETASEADIEALLHANAERIGKLGRLQAAFNVAVSARRETFKSAGGSNGTAA